MSSLIIGFLIAIVGLQVLILIGVMVFGFLIMDRTKLVPHFSSQLDLIESLVVGNAAGEPQMMTGAFRSLDGRHTASSLPELMDKMIRDDPVGSDPNKLGELFNGEIDDEEEDDEEPPEEWKKRKK